MAEGEIKEPTIDEATDPTSSEAEVPAPVDEQVVTDKAAGFQQRIEELDEEESRKNFLYAIEAFEFNRKLQSGDLITIRKLLKTSGIPKEAQYATILTLLEVFLVNFGKKPEPHVCVPGSTLEGLQNTFNLVRRFEEYFDDLVDVTRYQELLRKIGAQIAIPFLYFDETYKHPLSNAISYNRELDMLEEINHLAPIDNMEQVRSQAREVIATITLKKLERWYFEEGLEGQKVNDKGRIMLLATKYGIELPSEQEVWERDIAEGVKQMEKFLDSLEEQIAEGKRVHELLIKRRMEVDPTLGLITNAVEKFESIAVPAGYASLEEIESTVEARLSAIENQDIVIQINEVYSNLNNAIEQKREGRVSSALNDLFTVIRNNSEQISASDQIIERLKNLREELRNKIAALASQIQEDPLKSKDLGEELSANGQFLSTLENRIEEIEKLLNPPQ
ncbi:hypothetical protein ACFL3C_05615 [Patescibacteria group bacterium]